MHRPYLLVAVLLALAGCAAEATPVEDGVPARPIIERVSRAAETELPPASIPTLPTAGRLVQGHPDFVEQGEGALELIDYPWEQLGWPIHFLPTRSGHLGMTLVEEQRLEVYVRPEMSGQELAAVIAHEIGHVIDLVLLDDGDRARWLELRGLPEDTPWWPCEGCTDYDTGAGDFAEVFAHWLVPGSFRGMLAPPPDSAELETLLPLLTLPGLKPYAR